MQLVEIKREAHTGAGILMANVDPIMLVISWNPEQTDQLSATMIYLEWEG